MAPSDHAHRPLRSGHTLRRGAVLAAAASLCLGTLGALPTSAAPADQDGTAPQQSVTQSKGKIAAPVDPAKDANDQFIVTYKQGTASATKNGRANAWGKAAKEAGVSVKELRATATGSFVVKANKKLSDAEAEAFMDDLRASGTVDTVEPDTLHTITLNPNDARYSELWGLHGTNGMRVPGAWNTSTGSGTVVAVLDTGIVSHGDLSRNVVAGYDFVSDAAAARDGNGRDSNPQDEGDWYAAGECGQSRGSNSSWHGTHVAGTIGAVADTTGVVGVAPNTKIQPVRVLAQCGGRLSDISDAIVWASGGSVPGAPANSTPADVINMSLGGSGTCTATYQNAINTAVSRGTTVVVAAGNEGQDASRVVPASCNNVVTVASSTKNGGLAYYSNYGSKIDVTAPGGDTRSAGGGVLSTVDVGTTTPRGGGYAEYQGTSMATPHVAGLVALMSSAKSSLTPAQIESALKAGSRTMPGGCTAGCGAGLVDAAKVMGNLGGGTTPTPDPEEPAPTGQLLKNNGFESGSTGWTTSHSDAIESTANARSGSWHATLNGLGRASTYTVDQRVTLPAGRTATLGYHLNVGTDEGTSYAYDKLSVQVIDGSTAYTLKTHSNREKSTSYSAHSVDVSRFAGKTVTVRFRGVEDSSVPTIFRIDDTSLTVR